jgi:hypothetical protein
MPVRRACWKERDVTKVAKKKVDLAVAALLVSLFVLFAVASYALATRNGGQTAQERCERSGGIWHASAGHGAAGPHCMGGAAEATSR